jgi:hypothetical protein
MTFLQYRRAMRLGAVALAMFAAACDRGGATTEAPPEQEPAATATNRVAIPPAVRSNLGITFATVERRRVEQTLRVPGRFELLPTAVRQYHAMLPGRVALRVDQFDRVEAGDTLFWVDSPAWFEHQRAMGEVHALIKKLGAQLASFDALHEAHRQHASQLERTLAIRAERVDQLASIAEAGGGRRQELIDAQDAVATAEAQLAEVHETDARLEAEEAVLEAELAGAEQTFELLVQAGASMHGQPPAWLTSVEDRRPRWRTLAGITVAASAPGVVDSVLATEGSWADQDMAVLRVVQPNGLRIRASGLQSDLGVLREGLDVRIVPPTPTLAGRSVGLDQTMRGTLRLGLNADADTRTIDLFVTPDELLPWAGRGVSAQLEIVTDGGARAELAVPMAAVQRDGLTPVLFVRARDNAGEVVRTEADLGMDDGRWVVVKSGLREGDEIVLDGAFQLMLATSGSVDKGGHFHADGTFHEEGH